MNKLSGLCIAIAMGLSGCGGSLTSTTSTTSSSSTSTTPEGLWTGTIGSNSQRSTEVVLDDGTYYKMYSMTGYPNVIAGMIQGVGVSSNGSFTSANARDFNLQGYGVSAATISASYASQAAFNGSVNYASGAVATFTSTYNAPY